MTKKDAVQSANGQTPQKVGTLGIVKNYLGNDAVKKRFEEILKDKAPGFIQSIVSLVSSSTNFNGVDPNTIIASAFQAATLDLPINQNLGFAYIIPYGRKAQFQLGYKGFIQLALRTGQYKTINATEIYEGELVEFNRISGLIKLDPEKRKSDKIIGYAAYFQLINGFEKTLFMTVDELMEHGKKYSKSFNNGQWKDNPHVMMLKTVIKLLLSKYGILSVQLEKALQADQAIISESEDGEVQFNYEDNPETEEVETEVVEDEKTEPEETNWESPSSVLSAIENIKSLENYNNFRKTNKRRLEAFDGTPDGKLLGKALADKENELLKNDKN